ncbi:MAG: hypothetical protein M5E90_03550 [Asgard group archaeon]|nr:hypothetical protein [Asgard group archaeon]
MSYSSYTSSCHKSQLVESNKSSKKFPPHPLIYDLLNHPELNVISSNSPTPSVPPNTSFEHIQDLPRMLTPDQVGMMSTWQNIDFRGPPDSILSYSEGEDLDLEDTNQSHVMVFESEEEGEDQDQDDEVVITKEDEGEENTFIMPRMSVSSQGNNNSLTTTTTTTTTKEVLQGSTMNRTELIIIVRSSQEEDLSSFNDPLGLLNGWNAIYSFLVGIGLGLGFGFGFFY